MGKVIYLAHYGGAGLRRMVYPAGVTVMNYLIESVNAAGYDLTVISPAQLVRNEVHSGEIQRINEKTRCIYLPSRKRYGTALLPLKLLQKKKRERDLMEELDRTVQEGDTLIVYHSLALMPVISRMRRHRKFRLVLQVCEVYSDAMAAPVPQRRREELEFIRSADAYIFMSEALAQLLHGEREYAVCLGAYRWEPPMTGREKRTKIHVVYSGNLDPVKGGASAAVKAGEYLTEQYHLHILGAGNETQVAAVKRLIWEISRRTAAEITYDGVLLGEAYSRFLQQCDIGLSTQNPAGAFNATSFPSKILSYLSNGLRVVSTRTPVIEASAVGGFLHYYDEQEPWEIADAVRRVDLHVPWDAGGIVRKLDEDFVDALKKLLEGFGD